MVAFSFSEPCLCALLYADSESSVTFPGLLQFITGIDTVPPLGFTKSITVDFYDMSSSQHYPSSSTCDLRLWLPRGVGGDKLKQLLEEAVVGSPGFGKI